MIRNFLTLFILNCCAFSTLFANPGDTTHVRVHDRAHWSWYGNIDQTANFPNTATTYQQILLHYKLGCPAPRCSDWDYTTKIEILVPTGQVDTAGNAIKEAYEIARVMTPYGRNYDQNWQNEWLFDVTDYAPLLRGGAEIRAFYGGWSDGFLITLDFDFIEGTPARPVTRVRNLYTSGGGGWQFGNPNNPIETNVPARTVVLNPNTQAAKVRFITSGHGFNNAENCAEFCEKFYTLSVNGQADFGGSIWRNDCGNNSLYPQAGTWLYNRANWCPGEKTLHQDHNITDYLTLGGSNTIDIDFDNTYQNGSWQSNPAYYIVDAQLIEYAAPTVTNDVAMDDIVSPSKSDAYRRINPICASPQVRIRNKGVNVLNSCTIYYGIKNGAHATYNWVGSLEPNEMVDVVLPASAAMFNSVPTLEFETTVSNPNGQPDENVYNNTQTARFASPPAYNAPIFINFKTNVAFIETTWKLYNSAGALVRQRTPSFANQIMRDTLRNLPPDCYRLRIADSGCDGLSFFANSAGSGYIQVKDVATGNILYAVNDFGCTLNYNFTVGYAVPTEAEQASSTPDIRVFPNPNNGLFTVEMPFTQPTTVKIRIFNALGQIIQNTTLNDFAQTDLSVRLPENAPAGVYTLEIVLPNGTSSRKITKF
jgi:Peptide-N-glycosidase F, C terminal/Secretion system C-terminal sorting domain/Peptide-N-glycosidase F, N terminal